MANCVASRWVWTLVRLHEKGGKLHTMPCQHNLETYLTRIPQVDRDFRLLLLLQIAYIPMH